MEKKTLLGKLRRQWSDSAVVIKNNDDLSDDGDEFVQLDYNEDVYYGWNDYKGVRIPAPVQLKRPTFKIRGFRRPGDKLHLAVWDDDPAKLQKLVLNKGTYILLKFTFPNSYRRAVAIICDIQ